MRAPGTLTPRDVLQLQRLVGNRAVTQLLAGRAARPPRPAVQPKRPEDEEEIQAKSAIANRQSPTPNPRGSFEAGSDVERRLAARRGGGSPLPGEVRAFMEPRLGADLGGVRVHADGEAARLNRELSAQAFTYGQDVYVGAGRYNPGTEAGKRLLAHELTHVVQQTGAQVRTRPALPAGAIARRLDPYTIRRWSAFEHKAFGDLAAERALRLPWEMPGIPSRFKQQQYQALRSAGIGRTSDQPLQGTEEYRKFMGQSEELRADQPHRKMGVRTLEEKIRAWVVAKKHKSEAQLFQKGAEISVAYEEKKEPGWMPPLKRFLTKLHAGVLAEGVSGSLSSLKRALAKRGYNVHEEKEPRWMSLGDVSMLGGDYFAKPEDLKYAPRVSPAKLSDMQKMAMAMLTATGVNHFFPLVRTEFQAQYKKAQDYARTAHKAYTAKPPQRVKGDAYAKQATLYLGFALHFLQDSFASGHQYPRALDAIGTTWDPMTGLRKEGPRANSYHDALCALPEGLPMQYGGKFHGDDYASAQDAPVAEESYKAVGGILSIITGQHKNENWTVKPNPGPDVAAIMRGGGEARRVWSAMVRSVGGKLRGARRKLGARIDYQTEAGTKFKAREVLEECENVLKGGAGQRARVKPAPLTVEDRLVDAALEARGVLARTVSKEGITMVPKANLNARNKIRGILKGKEWKPKLSYNEAVLVIGALVSGGWQKEDEALVVNILDAQYQAQHANVSRMMRELAPELRCSELLAYWGKKGTAEANPGAEEILQVKDVKAAREVLKYHKGVKVLSPGKEVALTELAKPKAMSLKSAVAWGWKQAKMIKKRLTPSKTVGAKIGLMVPGVVGGITGFFAGPSKTRYLMPKPGERGALHARNLRSARSASYKRVPSYEPDTEKGAQAHREYTMRTERLDKMTMAVNAYQQSWLYDPTKTKIEEMKTRFQEAKESLYRVLDLIAAWEKDFAAKAWRNDLAALKSGLMEDARILGREALLLSSA